MDEGHAKSIHRALSGVTGGSWKARKVCAKVVPDVNREDLRNGILNNVSKSSGIYTDAHNGSTSLPALEFIHAAVSHVDEYVRGHVYTHGIDNNF